MLEQKYDKQCKMSTNLHLVTVEMEDNQKKPKTNEAKINQELKNNASVLCYRVRHMLTQTKYTVHKSLNSIKCSIKLRWNTSE